MSALESTAWESCILEPRRDAALEREMRRTVGYVPPLVSFLSDCPWLARAASVLNDLELGLRHVDGEMLDMVGLVVSQDNSCRYCYAIQRTLLRALGFSERRIRSLEQDFFAAQVDPRNRAALEYARRVSRCDPRPGPADRAALRAIGWSDDAIRELALAASLSVFLNRIATLLALPIDGVERLSRHWVWSLSSPIAGILIRRRRARVLRQPIEPVPIGGRFEELLRALDGMRAAAVLGGLLEQALASPLLAPRPKGLALAVIARWLGSRRCERVAAGLLEANGFPSDLLVRTLANLGDPELDAVEAALIPFARETIRYEPARIQRHARGLAKALPRAAFVELVGIASISNLICRLWLALEPT